MNMMMNYDPQTMQKMMLLNSLRQSQSAPTQSGGVAVPYTPMQGIGQMANAFSSGLLGRKLLQTPNVSTAPDYSAAAQAWSK